MKFVFGWSLMIVFIDFVYAQSQTNQPTPEISQKFLFDRPSSVFNQPTSLFNQLLSQFTQPSSQFGQQISSNNQPSFGFNQFPSSGGSFFDRPSSFGFNQPHSPFNQPSSSFNSPLNDFNQPLSGFNQPLSPFNSPSSGFNQPSSSFNQPSSSFNSPSSNFDQLSSGFNQPSSSFNSPSSGFNQPSSGFSNQPASQFNGPSQTTARFPEDRLPVPGKTCGTQITGDRIVGGMETALGEYPWLALIEYTKRGFRGQFFCGGSLINERYVLTAAHCFKSKNVIKSGFKPTSVRLGEHDVRTDVDCVEDECADPAIDVPIADIIVHENYEPESNLQNDDITLLRLARQVAFTNYVRPICLPLARHLQNKNLDRFPLFVSGFGKTEKGSKSDVKLKVEVDGFNWNRCNQLYKRAGLNLIKSQLCAGGKEGEDSCQGDSGGPLVGIDKSDRPYTYLAGIVSFGVGCGKPEFPGVYTRVDQYLDWILEHMRE